MARRKWTVEEVNEYRNKHSMYYYFNKEDSNLFIPKVLGFGWTINWGNPISWLIVVAIIIYIVL